MRFPWTLLYSMDVVVTAQPNARAHQRQSLHVLLQLPLQTAMFMANPSPRFGFVAFAETWNGRLAMLGFVIGLATELLTGQGILQQLGLG